MRIKDLTEIIVIMGLMPFVIAAHAKEVAVTVGEAAVEAMPEAMIHIALIGFMCLLGYIL